MNLFLPLFIWLLAYVFFILNLIKNTIQKYKYLNSIINGFLISIKTLKFNSLINILIIRIIIGSILILFTYSLTLSWDEMFILNTTLIIGFLIFYLEKECYIKNTIKNIIYLYRKNKILLFTLYFFNTIIIITYINILIILIININIPCLMYLLKILNANILCVVFGLDCIPSFYKVLSSMNNSLYGGIENINTGESSTTFRGNNNNNPKPPAESNNLIVPVESNDFESMKNKVIKKLESQVEEHNNTGERLKPIFSDKYPDKAKFNAEEKRFILDYISSRPESGYSVRTIKPNTRFERTIVVRGVGRNSNLPEATATRIFIRVFK